MVGGVAFGGAGAEKYALGGSLVVNVVVNTIDAHISKNSRVTAAEDIVPQNGVSQAADRWIRACVSDNDDPLEAALHADFRLAHIVRQDTGARQDTGLERWVRGVLDHLGGQQPHDSLPLDLQATAFQRQVWQQLQSIPYGETRTYQEIAERLGRPNAARAVGRACATNPVSIVIPCHRAVGAGGSLTGYRWGIERKRALQERERANAT
ncbi:MAG: methylated-DNA--[protein]-cysteine S-methyltransferase [Chloroflexi bacterium]|nr:methylated-DNA--[protein]-cysteine S-methyltransferase [Chloroflexota bacterium]